MYVESKGYQDADYATVITLDWDDIELLYAGFRTSNDTASEAAKLIDGEREAFLWAAKKVEVEPEQMRRTIDVDAGLAGVFSQVLGTCVSKIFDPILDPTISRPYDSNSLAYLTAQDAKRKALAGKMVLRKWFSA